MTHFELMESVGQTNIFDYLPKSIDRKRNKAFMEGDRVKIRFYVDEIEEVKKYRPKHVETGEIIGKKLDFYIVQFEDSVAYVDGGKLMLV